MVLYYYNDSIFKYLDENHINYHYDIMSLSIYVITISNL